MGGGGNGETECGPFFGNSNYGALSWGSKILFMKKLNSYEDNRLHNRRFSAIF